MPRAAVSLGIANARFHHSANARRPLYPTERNGVIAMANTPRRNRNAAASAATDNAAPSASIHPIGATQMEQDNAAAIALDGAKLAHAAAIAPAADTTPVESPNVKAARAALDSLKVAQTMLRENAPDAAAALDDRIELANGVLALAIANDALDAEKARQIEATTNAAAASGIDADTLAHMLAAIERKYAPVESTPPPTLDADAPRRLQVSDRTLAANAAALADNTLQTRAAETLAAFDADSGKLQCKVNRRPNTRFSGMVALAPSGGGVANANDYDALTRAIRAYLITVKGWQTSDNDGQTVPESKWLAARGRYVIGGGVKSALDCFHSDAEIALYPDGQFRFAYHSTPNVRFLRTDNAAWSAFVSGRAAAPVAPTTPTPPTSSAPVSTPHVPTPPSASSAIPTGGITPSARCQHCSVRNVLTDLMCDNCGAADWRIA
jgi:hypothetical protein